MKDVLFFHPQNDYTGSTRVLANVITSEYSGQIVDVITKRNLDKGFLSELPNVRIINSSTLMFLGKKIPFVTPLSWRIQAFLLALFYGWRYETFYINTIVPFYAALVGRLYGKRIIYHVHEKFRKRSLSVKLMEWTFSHIPAHRIFVSLYTLQQYQGNSKCTEEILYNKLGADFLAKLHVRPLKERKRNNVLMIASLSKMKGIFNFLRLASLVPEYYFRLVLNTSKDEIEAFITEKIPENVELIPAQSNIHPYLYNADLMLNMSIPFMWIETFGMTILEAMAYGIPAIVPNVGGPLELIENDFNGYCVDVTDIELMADTIRVSLEQENYERLVKNALIRFNERFR